MYEINTLLLLPLDLIDNIEAHKIIDFIKETCFYKQL